MSGEDNRKGEGGHSGWERRSFVSELFLLLKGSGIPEGAPQVDLFL